MRLQLLICLLLIMAWPLMGSFLIEELDFSADFPLDKTSLIKASGLSLGSSVETEDIQAATVQIQAYLITGGRQFVHVPNPQIIPLGDNRIKLIYEPRETLPSDRCQLDFIGLRYFTRAKLLSLLMIPETKAQPIGSLGKTMGRILELYTSRGYLFASVNLDSLMVLPDSSLQAVIRIVEGKPFRPQHYIFQGNKHTRSSSLIRSSGLSSLKQITPGALETARLRILDKPYIKDAEVIPLDDSSLLIKIEEGRMTYLEGVAGISQQDNKTRITGLFRLQFLNLWGSDRAIDLNWRQLPNSSSQLKLSYHDSGFERYPFAADLAFFRAQQDSLWIRSKMGLDLYYYHQAHQLGIELSAENVIPGFGRPTTFEKSDSRAVGGFWSFRQSDHRSNPSRGLELEARYRIYPKGSLKNLDNALELNGETYLPFNSRWVSALGIHFRDLHHDAPEDYMLFTMGGYHSLRGYREDEFKSKRLGWANLELRFRLSRESRAFIFFDQGILSTANNVLKTDIFALGTGLKLGTKLGILSLEYALGYNGKSLNPFGLGMVHAGLDTSF